MNVTLDLLNQHKTKPFDYKHFFFHNNFKFCFKSIFTPTYYWVF